MNTLKIEARSDVERAREVLSAPLGFGRTFADLMVRAHHDEERGWYDAAVVPYGPLELWPAAKVLHYSLEIFEGHKAYGWPGGEVALFRPELNASRLNASAARLCMPEVPVDFQLAATETLMELVRDWVPREPGTSLYIRPMLVGTDPCLGVMPSRTHEYLIIAGPVGSYFPRGFSSVAIYVEEEEVRAATGGVGAAKTGGNYSGGLAGQERARAAGYDQVLWLDACEHRYIEELHAMNVFIVEGETVVTPPLEGTILPGVTRQSVLELAADLGLGAEERPLPIDEVVAGIAEGRVAEMFAAGTAAVITPIGALGYRGRRVVLGDGQPGGVARRVYEAITGIQYGRREDRRGWMRVVPRRAEAPEVAEVVASVPSRKS
jgi:branched-chain amino acid aminotransferase